MLISVIIPCYNVEAYIEECISSVFNQTYESLEIICIDNNSNDNTWRILKELKQSYPEIIIDKELKPGASAARNKGLLLSKGIWIQFLDADDLLLPDKLYKQIELIFNKKNVSFVVGNSIKRGIDGSESNNSNIEQEYFIGHLKSQLGNTCSNLFNRKYLDKIGGWDESFKSSQEAKLMFDLLKVNYNIEYDKSYNTVIRDRKVGRISQNDPIILVNRYVNLRFEIAQFLKAYRKKIYNDHYNEINQILFDSLRVLAKYDLDSALKIFNKNLKGFIPEISEATTKKYLLIYKLVGFKWAERIKKII